MLKPSMVILVALVGCGSAGNDDPLTGSWKKDACHPPAMISAGVQTCSTVLKFTADLKFTFTATEQAPPAAPVTPRCLTTHEVTGQNWSVSGGKFTLGGTPKATVKVTDCVNSSDNKGSSEDTVTTVANDGYAYTISGTSLAVSSGALAGTYIKQ